MGTRADFYIGRGADAEWLGSIAWDGYPDGLRDEPHLLTAKSPNTFRKAVARLATRDDWTAPDKGWPWPWEDSRTTDYAYAFDAGHVYGSCFGHRWFRAERKEPDNEDRPQDAVFPNMKARQKVALDGRSGLLIIGSP